MASTELQTPVAACIQVIGTCSSSRAQIGPHSWLSKLMLTTCRVNDPRSLGPVSQRAR
jgi:hypothetical protein